MKSSCFFSQVKKLVSVIDTIVGSKSILDSFGCLKQLGGDCSLRVTNSSLMERDYVHVRCEKLSMDENTSVCTDRNSNDISSTNNQALENDMIEDTEHNVEHTLYEEADEIDVGKRNLADTFLFSTPDVNTSIQSNTITNIGSTHVSKLNKVQTRCTSSDRDEACCNSPDLKPILYEQCCDLSCDISEREQTAVSTLSQSSLSQDDSDLEHCSASSTDVPSTVGKCVKVYTPKRRKSVDEVRNKLVHTQCNLVPITPPSTDSIDLLDEPSANDVPVTLLTSLDMESAEYILSLSAESIQSIVGGSISDQHTVIGCREMMNAERDAAKENSPSDTDCAKPVLRRSTRLNQQESDEAASNGFTMGNSAGTEKQFKKSNSPNRTESAKVKRKCKEDRKVLDSSTGIVQSSKKNSSSKRSRSKLIIKKSNKSTCTVTSNKEKDESKPKASSRFKVETDQSAVSFVKPNTCECINRALWGDMSDTLDNRESEIDLLAYPSNTEIPFAVGLLPLRAALEKMQATPDYQPRKTRSSVAPVKQDAAGSLKRKNGNNNNESPNTVCHIQIRTAQCVKSRKRFLSDSITSLPATDVASGRE